MMKMMLKIAFTLLMTLPNIEAVTCSWENLTYTSNLVVQSVGSPASFSVSVTGTVSNFELFYWYLNSTPVAEWRYTQPNFVPNLGFSRGEASIFTSSSVTTFSINFTALEETDTGTSLQAVKSGCNLGQTSSNSLPLNVEYCTATSGGNRTGVDMSSIATSSRYNDVVYPSCLGDLEGNVSLTCTQNTRWSQQGDCAKATTTTTTTTTMELTTPSVTTKDLNNSTSEPDVVSTVTTELSACTVKCPECCGGECYADGMPIDFPLHVEARDQVCLSCREGDCSNSIQCVNGETIPSGDDLSWVCSTKGPDYKLGGEIEAYVGAVFVTTGFISAPVGHVKYKLKFKIMRYRYGAGLAAFIAWVIGIGLAIGLPEIQVAAIIGLVIGASALVGLFIVDLDIIMKIYGVAKAKRARNENYGL